MAARWLPGGMAPTCTLRLCAHRPLPSCALYPGDAKNPPKSYLPSLILHCPLHIPRCVSSPHVPKSTVIKVSNDLSIKRLRIAFCSLLVTYVRGNMFLEIRIWGRIVVISTPTLTAKPIHSKGCLLILIRGRNYYFTDQNNVPHLQTSSI